MSRLVLATLLLVGCADTGDEGMIILNNTATTDSCTLTGAKDQPFNPHGEIFAGAQRGYVFTPLIESRITTIEGDLDDAQRTIFMSGANVSLEVVATTVHDLDSDAFTNPTVTLSGTQAQFSTLFSASLPPAGTANVAFELIPAQTMRAIEQAVNPSPSQTFRAEVLASVSVFGKLGGEDVDSPVFQFPVSVCTDCVVNDLGMCLDLEASPRTGNACNQFQDGVIDCCEASTGGLVCPAVAEEPPQQ